MIKFNKIEIPKEGKKSRFATINSSRCFFEIGPSRILRGLIKKINPHLKVINIEKKEDLS